MVYEITLLNEEVTVRFLQKWFSKEIISPAYLAVVGYLQWPDLLTFISYLPDSEPTPAASHLTTTAAATGAFPHQEHRCS